MKREESVLVAIGVVVLLASLQFGFLNGLVPALPNKPGFDFYQMPRGFLNLTSGNNIFLTEISDYGDEASPYFNHPLAAVLVGPWTSPFPPMAAYWIFACFSIVLLLGCAAILATLGNRPLAYFAMLCSPAIYAMLWCGQIHVFLVLAVTLMIVGFAQRKVWPIQVGLLLALLTKPAIILVVPLLLFLPETRWQTVKTLAVYAAISLAFILPSRLNPGGYNGIHWAAMALRASSTATNVYGAMAPREANHSVDMLLFSLPRLLCRHPLLMQTTRAIALSIIAAMSASVLALPKQRRMFAAMTVLCLVVMSHYLCYFLAYEYHYASLLPLLPALWWMQRRNPSRLLTTAMFCIGAVFVPLPYLASLNVERAWLAHSLFRVAPVVAAFALVAAVGVQYVRRYANWRLFQLQLPPALGATTLSCLAAALVLGAVWFTLPERFYKTPHKWTAADWTTQFKDILSRPGVCKKSSQFMTQTVTHLESPSASERNAALRELQSPPTIVAQFSK